MFAITRHTFVQGSVLIGKLRVNRWSPMKRISRAFSFINFLISTFKFCLSFKAGLSYKDFFWFQGSWVSGGLHFTHFLALNFNLLFVGGLGSWIFRFSGFGFMLFVGIHGSPTTSGRHIQATWGLDLKVRGFFYFIHFEGCTVQGISIFRPYVPWFLRSNVHLFLALALVRFLGLRVDFVRFQIHIFCL